MEITHSVSFNTNNPEEVINFLQTLTPPKNGTTIEDVCVKKLIETKPEENLEEAFAEDFPNTWGEKPTEGKLSDGGNWIGGTGWNFTYIDKECKEGKNHFEAGVEYTPVGPNGEEIDLYELIHGPREKPDHDKAMEIPEVPEYEYERQYVNSSGSMYYSNPDKEQIKALTDAVNLLVKTHNNK